MTKSVEGLSKAKAKILADVNLSIQEQTEYLNDLARKELELDKFDTQQSMVSKTVLSFEELSQIGLDIHNWDPSLKGGTFSDYLLSEKEKAEARGLNGEEIIKQRYGLKWNDESRAFDIVDYATYWTNVLQMGQAVGLKYELAYQ